MKSKKREDPKRSSSAFRKAAHDTYDHTRWTDEELRLVLVTVPSPKNVLLLAKRLRRTPESIMGVFRWAAQD